MPLSSAHTGWSEGRRDENARGAHLEHLPHLEQLQREGLGEAFQHPAPVGLLLDQAEAAEADQEFAHRRGADADLAGKVGFIDLVAGGTPVPRARAA